MNLPVVLAVLAVVAVGVLGTLVATMGSAQAQATILGGNQVIAPITAPIDDCGNGVGALGTAAPACKAVGSAAGGA